ncbi:MAG: molybdopterin molybdotransferase MoeA [Saprospiraceae bacterium]|nr:molybdopterin molybdotransferase MoeA [Saprospiraceae bacterium]
MVSVKEAKNLIQQRLKRSATIKLPLLDVCKAVLAEDLYSPIDVPSFDNSAMDGFAFAYEESRSEYVLVGQMAAGDSHSLELKPGEAARIFTGAPIPHGANTVIQQEKVRILDQHISFNPQEIGKGSNLRLKSSQCKQGDLIALKGSILYPGTIGLIASVGISEVLVYNIPSVGVLVTGSELQSPGIPLSPGQIYNSNWPTVCSYLQLLGIEKIHYAQISDHRELLKNQIQENLKNQDVLILTGGVSVGEYDFVKPLLEELGVETLFYKVNQRPGKPLYVGLWEGKWIFGLPGNPGSVICCFNLYVKPVLKYWMGHKEVFNPVLRAPLARDWSKKKGISLHLKVNYENGKVNILPNQESFNLMAFPASTHFVLLDEEAEELRAGDFVELYQW